jgi:toxin-antitoxin system PIN domain toxin
LAVTVLLDTNILIHAANAASRFHAEARRLRDQALEGALHACLTPQILWEFYSVMTNPRRVERPLPPELALREVQAYVQAEQIGMIIPLRTTYRRALELLRRHRVRGRRVFDLYLVATMLDHEISTLYTENVADFQEFGGVKVVNPFQEAVLR